jgi:hypothetical protein
MKVVSTDIRPPSPEMTDEKRQFAADKFAFDDLLSRGLGEIAFVKLFTVGEAKELFPKVTLPQGGWVLLVLAANGDLLDVVIDHYAAMRSAHDKEVRLVSMH